MLTTGIDTFPGLVGSAGTTGTDGNDTINATNTTLTALDTIDGGNGTDTLNILNAAAAPAALPAGITVTNVETVNVRSANDIGVVAGAAFDVSGFTGLTTLNTTQSVDAAVTAALTTDINVSGATGDIEIDGGKNVSVTDATAAKNITIGAVVNAGTITVTDTDNSGANAITVNGGTDVTVTATTKANATGIISVGDTVQATGDVKVTQNLNSDGVATLTNSGTILVEGGKTVDVTVNATSTAKTNTSNSAITIGSVKVTGDSKTTDVTVTQNKSVTTKTADTVAEVKDTQTITFKALTAGQNVSITDGAGKILTFTASKALTADQVAAAFANLVADDRQDAGGKVANGVYTGQFAANWSAKSVSGATVTFEAPASNTTTLADNSSTVAPTISGVTAGTAATGGTFSTNAVAYGAVDIQDNATAAIKTVTIDGFASALIGKDTANTAADTSLDALTTLNLANNTANGAVTVATDATKLALGVNNITGTSVVNLDHTGLNADAITIKTAATVADLTINATGKDSTFTLTAGAVKDLIINADVALNISTSASTNYATANLKTVDVNGAGAVNLGILTTTKLNSFDASGNTGGVTAEINTATANVDTITNYIFSEGNDVVTLAQTAVNTKITLGAGDDKITLASGSSTATVTKVIDGGTGLDTIHMVDSDAATNTSGVAFQELITGFEKLSVGLVSAARIVNLDNLDDINYVISNGTGAVAVPQVTEFTYVTFTAGDVLKATINGVEYSYTVLAGDTNETGAVAKLLDIINADKNVAVTASATAGKLTLTADVAGNPFTATTAAPGTGTFATAGAGTANVTALTLQDILSGGTVELAATGNVLVNVKGATLAANTTDTFNIITNDAPAAGTDFGSVIANGVETLNVTTTNTFVDTTGATDGNSTPIADGKDDTTSKATLSVVGDKATTVNVDGAGDLVLTTYATTLTKVDATNMTGALTYTTTVNSVTVNGGQAADKLTANANDVKLNGGAGNDTLTVKAGADRAILDGGLGNDKFVIDGAASTSSTYANILNVNTGDTIQFTGANAFAATKVTLSVGATETTQALMDLAVNNLASNQMGWFQTGGNTFIVMDADTNGTTGFVDGQDMVVMITGLVDLSTASYNATSNTIEIA